MGSCGSRSSESSSGEGVYLWIDGDPRQRSSDRSRAQKPLEDVWVVRACSCGCEEEADATGAAQGGLYSRALVHRGLVHRRCHGRGQSP